MMVVMVDMSIGRSLVLPANTTASRTSIPFCLLMLAIFGFLLVSFIIDSMLILLGGGAKAFGKSLSDEAQRSSSSGDSDSGYDRWGYDENGSAHKLENIGGGYARDSDGRRWKSDGGSKYHLDE